MMTQDRSHAWVSETEAQDYSATLTGNPFLFRETKMLLGLLRDGMTVDQAAQQIIDGNLFQYRSAKSLPKRVNALISRFAGVPSEVRTFIVEAPQNEARVVLILVLSVRDRLFREFLQELVLPAAGSHDPIITRAAAERFFEAKAMISPKVAGWSPEARTKLRTVFMAALVESGLVVLHGRDHVVRLPVLSPETQDVVRRYFPPQYQFLLGGMT